MKYVKIFEQYLTESVVTEAKDKHDVLDSIENDIKKGNIQKFQITDEDVWYWASKIKAKLSDNDVDWILGNLYESVVNEGRDNLYLQLHKKYAESIKGLKAKKISKLTDLVSVQRWSMEDREDYFDMNPKKRKELSAEYDEERKLFKKYLAGNHSVLLRKGTESLAESVNEVAEPQIQKIAELTGVSIDKVEKYVSSRVLNITKLLKYIKDEKQVAIREFEKAVNGDEKQDAYFIKMFNESVVTEGKTSAAYIDPKTGKGYDLQYVSSKKRWELDIMKKGASIYSSAITTIKRDTLKEIQDWLDGYKIDSKWTQGLSESLVTEAKMPNKYIGNDEIVYLKTKEDSKGAHYNLYYKGHDIDAGGRRFGSSLELTNFADDYILSNQLYNKLKHVKSKPLPESVNEAKPNQTMEIIGKIKDVASQLGFSAFTTLDSLKTATKGTILEFAVKQYKSTDINAAYMFVDGWGYHLLVVMPSEQNPGEIDIDFYKMNEADYKGSASMDYFYGNKESKTWTFKKTWKEWFTL